MVERIRDCLALLSNKDAFNSMTQAMPSPLTCVMALLASIRKAQLIIPMAPMAIRAESLYFATATKI